MSAHNEWPLALLSVVLLLLPGRSSSIDRVHAGSKRRSRVLWLPRSGVTREEPHAVATVFDLLAACLRAGLPTASAVGAVAAGAPASLGAALHRTSELLALGADPETAWTESKVWAETTGKDAGGTATEFDALARMARRSARSGASMAAAVEDLAGQRRTAMEDAAIARAERAGVLIGGPLGLCFLPAFICLGIVPVVIGLAQNVLGGGLL